MCRHRRRAQRWGCSIGLTVGFVVVVAQGNARAVFLDREETIRLNGRVYNRTAYAVNDAAQNTRLQIPYSNWNMLQSRTSIQLELRHNLTDLLAGRYEGLLSFLRYPLAPLRVLDPDDLEYFVTYRGEYDGVWDYGPDVFSEAYPLLSTCVPITKAKKRHPRAFVGCTRLDTRRRLRHRHRLFEAYVNYTKGPVFVRIGRQNLSWGETDVFRLLDQINPLDASFGGFLVPLDERRVPLDMLRAVYGFGSRGPFAEINLEGYVALDDEVAAPVPIGSPWSTPNPPGIKSFVKKPARNFTDARGGGRIIGVLGDVTFSVAHFYTYLDTATLRVMTPATKPPVNLGAFTAAVRAGQTAQFLASNFAANVMFPKVQISGGTVSFSVPQLYAVVRGEFAYFYAEPFFLNSAPNQILGPALAGRVTPGYRQVGTDPVTGELLLRYKNNIDRSDVVRWSLGLDINRYIRFLNPSQSFFISAQAFGTHIVDFEDTPLTSVVDSFGFAHFAVPVRDPHRNNQAFVNLDAYQIINTLLISTSYRSGVIAPSLAFFYDWQGAWVLQPGVTFVRDPLRLTLQYNYIDGQFNGIGFLRDRDNVIVQLEFVI